MDRAGQSLQAQRYSIVAFHLTLPPGTTPASPQLSSLPFRRCIRRHSLLAHRWPPTQRTHQPNHQWVSTSQYPPVSGRDRLPTAKAPMPTRMMTKTKTIQ